MKDFDFSGCGVFLCGFLFYLVFSFLCLVTVLAAVALQAGWSQQGH